ncbi:hypothetical protein DICSQDRAFT_153221 [Dichomitus squalens LYAD-421 SS1]|uniref:uncharacterized protein n=1 Tax=Dichomitus squalens (strain LYAD-421) TaxID=732165 RepID=UPI000441195F|nr:uncharacterized protein DICSQDRAFT_153221 [Dichomitus squalens LYAD-421 SS1]EJF64102.1 hypothetical protein DICSQDRAFT_153221 [Dichomitus squalens LYAD-421 SS1]
MSSSRSPDVSATDDKQKKAVATKAPPPFDREDADLIISTRDNVDFHVHRVVLSLGSTVFENMFSFPQPAGTDVARPHVDISEDSKAMETFLRIIYPIPDPEFKSLQHLHSVLAAGTKYDAAAVIALARKKLTESSFLQDDPLRVFAIACLFHMADEAKMAAELAVRKSRVTGTCPELDAIPAGAYHRLLALQRDYERSRTSSSLSNLEAVFSGFTPLRRNANETDDRQTGAKFRRGDIETTFVVSSDPILASDVIIRSSDNHEFYVHRVLLTLASPTMLSMLESVADNDVAVHTGSIPVPIYKMPESVLVVRDILRHCYPIQHSSANDIHDPKHFLAVLSAVRKYQLKGAEAAMRGQWKLMAHLDPLRFYFAAVEYRWKDEVLESARGLIQHSQTVNSIHSLYIPSMETIPNAAYYRLLLYVNQCVKAATSGITVQSLPATSCASPWLNRSRKAYFRESVTLHAIPPEALRNLLSEVTAAVRDKPLGSSIAATSPAGQAFLKKLVSFKCHCSTNIQVPPCSEVERLTWGFAFLKQYGETIDKAVSNVVFETKFIDAA